MSTPLIKTKLHIPPLRPDLVPRPRLIERLNHGLRQAGKLTFISAPAGYGKTTLIAEWLSQLVKAHTHTLSHSDTPTPPHSKREH